MSRFVLKNTDETLVLSLYDPRLFRAIEVLCKDALSLSQHHPAIRRSVGSVYFLLRTAALEKYGHETPDVFAIKMLLERTDANGRPRAPAREVLPYLYEKRQINEDQVRAGKLIAEVWRGMGRFLDIQGRSYDGAPSGARSRVLHPADIMGTDLNDRYRAFYCPWYETAKRKTVASKNLSVGHKSVAALVLYAIVHQMLPKTIDHAFRLKRNTTINVLRNELTALAMRMSPNDRPVPNRDELPDAQLPA